MTPKQENTLNFKTIQVSAQCYEEINSLKARLEKIFNTSISFSKLIRVLIASKVNFAYLIALEQEATQGEPFKEK